MKKRWFILIAVVLLVAVVLAACGKSSYKCEDPYGCVNVAPGQPIKIGAALVLSGPNESLGVDSLGGVEIAVDDFTAANKDWLAKGKHSIQVVKEDSQCSAEGGQTAAQKLAADKSIVGVIGTNCSSAGEPASKILSDAHIPMISPSNTAPSLTAPKTHAECYLRTAHNDKVQGKAVAEFAYKVLGARTMATIHDGSPYAEQLQQVACDVFTQLGGKCVAQEAINVGDTDMRPVLTKIAATHPDVLYYPIFIQEGALITQQAKEVPGLEKTVLMGSDGMISPDFIKAAGKAAEGMYLSGPAAVNNEEFNKKYEAKYGQEPPSAFHLHAYDATMMLLDAIKKVAVVDKDGTIHIPRKALCQALFSTKNFKGLTGTLTCNQYGDCADPKININKIINGKYVPVWPKK